MTLIIEKGLWLGESNEPVFVHAPVGTVIRFNNESATWKKTSETHWGSSNDVVRLIADMVRTLNKSKWWTITVLSTDPPEVEDDEPEAEVGGITAEQLRKLEAFINERIQKAYAEGQDAGYRAGFDAGFDAGYDEAQ